MHKGFQLFSHIDVILMDFVLIICILTVILMDVVIVVLTVILMDVVVTVILTVILMDFV